MEYITAHEAAELHQVTPRRIQLLAATERIPGAKKFGGVWMIPEGFTVQPPPKRRRKPAKINTVSTQQL